MNKLRCKICRKKFYNIIHKNIKNTDSGLFNLFHNILQVNSALPEVFPNKILIKNSNLMKSFKNELLN